MAEALIQVRDLKKYYNGGDVKALDGVTADICKGDVMAVIGPSGGGKAQRKGGLALAGVVLICTQIIPYP